MNKAPIGVFDSGVGGLTVLKQMQQKLPHESFIYLGDLARLPYGKKSTHSIISYITQGCSYLESLGVKAIVLACNTASSIFSQHFADNQFNTPITGVVKPGALTAVAKTTTKNIAVIATPATTISRSYVKEIQAKLPDAHVTGISAPLLVSIAEEGWINDPITKSVITRYLSILNKLPNIDTLVLGCTHFPILMEDFSACINKNIQIVDSATTTADYMLQLLTEKKILQENTSSPTTKYLVTDNKDRFIDIAKILGFSEINEQEVKLIQLEDLSNI